MVLVGLHYYVVHTYINPTQIVPKGPDLSGWPIEHGREALGGHPFGDGTPPGPVRESERVHPAHTPQGCAATRTVVPSAANRPSTEK